MKKTLKTIIKLRDIIYIGVILIFVLLYINEYYEVKNYSIKLANCYKTCNQSNLSFREKDYPKITKTSVTSECDDEVASYLNTLESQISNMYPVGSIYTSTTLSTPSSVHDALGGTWETYGSGRVLVGLDATQTEFDTLGETGGSKNQILRAWIGAVDGSSYKIGYWHDNWTFTPTGSMYVVTGSAQSNSYSSVNHTTIVTQKSGAEPTTLQPYVVVYMYKKIS